MRSRKAKTSRTSSKPPSSDEPWDKEVQAKAFFVPSFKAAIFMTDGISDPYFEAHSKVKYDSDPHWTHLLDDLIRGDGPTGEEVSRPGPLSVNTKREEQLGSLERWSEFYMAGAHDDRTIVIVRPATAKEV